MDKGRNTHDEIARVAYELCEKRGKAHGHEMSDWLEAERIVMRTSAPGKRGETKGMKSSKRAKTPDKRK